MRNKLVRFQENAERRNVVEPGKEIFDKIKGNWKAFFDNDQPVVLELGCGKGEYTVGLGRLFPENNYVGIDVKGARIWVGSTLAEEEQLSNVAFLRIRILDLMNYVEKDEIDGIWITFPDPRPRERDIKRRLTSERFMDMYKSALKPDGWVNFKTDNQSLFEFTLEQLQERKDIRNLEYTFDFHQSEFPEKDYKIITGYEKRFISEGVTIKFLKFQFI